MLLFLANKRANKGAEMRAFFGVEIWKFTHLARILHIMPNPQALWICP